VSRLQLNNHNSISTAELCNIPTSSPRQSPKPETFLIFSNSLSAIQSLLAHTPDHRLAAQIIYNLPRLYKRNCLRCVCWVPGHAGLPSNEVIDSATKEAAADEHCRVTEFQQPLPARNFTVLCTVCGRASGPTHGTFCETSYRQYRRGRLPSRPYERKSLL
jgi:hypothetical protein